MALQDQFTIVLLMDAGLGKFKAGALTIDQFMDSVAGVWAKTQNYKREK